MNDTTRQQIQKLEELKNHKGYGILFIMSRPGDVAFAVSPVPGLREYEIVCASPDGLYDLWKDGNIDKPDLTREEVSDWIRKATPEWLYDDSEVTVEQAELVQAWVLKLRLKYPGPMTVR